MNKDELEDFAKKYEEYMQRRLKNMKYENKDDVLPNNSIDGRPATYGEIFQGGIDALQSACEHFFELDDDNGKAVAYMCDSALRWAIGMYEGKDPLLHAISNGEYGDIVAMEDTHDSE